VGMVIGDYFENMSILDKTEVSFNLEPISPGSKSKKDSKPKSNKKGKKGQYHENEHKKTSLF
jgi:hypothetical protein